MKNYQELLKSNFWIIPDGLLPECELDFLKEFFYIKKDFSIDENTLEERKFYILEKKEKFLGLQA
jgi:hypothetical protein